VSGKRVLATLVLIVLATAVVPPGIAWIMNQRRISRAASDIAVLAEELRRGDRALPSPQLLGVLSGPGRMPVTESAATSRWGTAPRGSLAAAIDRRERVPIDPWGNCYVVNIGANGANQPATLWVLSAGPNGIIETPFLGPSDVPAGDDVARRIR
jgi:type II secretory pathway pseudopilin PulG